MVVETGALADAAAADVLVGAAAEVTRALEGGAAAADSDAEVARVRWLLVVPAGNPQALRGLTDVERAGGRGVGGGRPRGARGAAGAAEAGA